MTRIPWPGARLTLFTAAVVVASVASCVPPDDEGPPVTPQSESQPPPPPPSPPEGTGPATPGLVPAGAGGAPAAGEYTIGEDADAYDDRDPAALTDFRGALDPNGTWTDDPTYGRVWTPSPGVVGQDFQPYVTAGHWAYDSDWVWVSDYDWGWAPFHYGRWVWIEGRGWSWIPGRAYRGAWVVWSADDDFAYLGWAPAPPLFVWFYGAPVWWGGGYIGPRWVYCPRREVFVPAVGTRVVTGSAAVPLAAHMRLYVSAGAGGSGPPPHRLGYAPAQVPRPTGAAQAQVARAQQYSRASTAQAVGARPPSRVPASAMAVAPASRPGASDGTSPASPGRGRNLEAIHPAPGPAASPAPHANTPAPRANAPAPHFAPAQSFHGGGGGHHR